MSNEGYTIEIVLVHTSKRGARRIIKSVLDTKIGTVPSKKAEEFFDKRALEMTDQ
jgi:hypothetical protein